MWYATLLLTLCLTYSSAIAQAQWYNRNAPSAQGLMAWWRGDTGFTGGPLWYDKVGQSHGTLTSMGTAGTTSGWAAGSMPNSKAMDMRFDGTNDYVIATTNKLPFVAAGQYTWTFWMYPTNVSTQWQSVWGQTVTLAATPYLAFYLHTTAHAAYGPVTNGVSVGIESSAGNYLIAHTTNNAMVVNQWQHLVVTYDGTLATANKVKIYVNGVNLTDTADVESVGTITNIAATIATIGHDTLGDPTIAGRMNDVRVYNRAMLQPEVVYTMQQGLLGEPDLFNPQFPLGFVAPFPPDFTGYPGAQRYNAGHPLLQGLAAWWLATPNFVGGPKFYDVPGRAHCTLTNTNGTTASGWNRTTRPGGIAEVTLDGTDDYLNCIPPALAGGEYTWATWVKVSTVAHSWLLNSTYPGGHKLQISLGGGNWAGNARALSFQINEFYTNNLGAVNSLPAPGPWMHLAITMSVSHNQSIGYLNGVSTGTANMETDPFGGVGTLFTLGFYIAETPAASFDDYTMWNRVLTAQEIQQVYVDGYSGHTALLTSPPIFANARVIASSSSRFFNFWPSKGR